MTCSSPANPSAWTNRQRNLDVLACLNPRMWHSGAVDTSKLRLTRHAIRNLFDRCPKREAGRKDDNCSSFDHSVICRWKSCPGVVKF